MKRFGVLFALLTSALNSYSQSSGSLVNTAARQLGYGRADSARTSSIAALNLADSDSLRSLSLYYLASSYQELDSLNKSGSTYDLAISTAEKAGIDLVLTKALSAKGVLLSKMGMFAPAELLLNRALRTSQKLSDLRLKALCNQHLGNFYFNKENYPKALTYYEVAYGHAESLEDIPLMAICLQNLSSASVGVGDYARAEECIKKCIEYYDYLDEQSLLSEGYRNLLQSVPVSGGAKHH